MKAFLITLVMLIYIAPYEVVAQERKDSGGNPIIEKYFIQTVLKDMALEAMDGKVYYLKDFRGKIVIIDFWQTWCAPCLEDFKGLQKARESWPDKIEILAVSPDWADSPMKVRRFIRKTDYDFKFVWAGELEKQLSLKSIPFKIIIAPDGSLIASKSGSAGAQEEYKAMAGLVEHWF